MNTAARVLDGFSRLGPTERWILRRRYGLGDYQRMTLGDTGKAMGLTRLEVKGIELTALTKLGVHEA